MTTPVPETMTEYIRRMANDGGGGLATPSEILDNVDASFAELATVVTDPENLPETSTIRPAGSFTDANSLHQYLENGGLVVTDAAGDASPIGFVWLLKVYDDILNEFIWQVYIDENT